MAEATGSRCRYTLTRPSLYIIALEFGVPRVFVQYSEDVEDIFRPHGLHQHLFADDMMPGCCSRRLDDAPAVVFFFDLKAASSVWRQTSTARRYDSALSCGIWHHTSRRLDAATVVWSCIAAASAVIPEQFHPCQPVCRQASDCRLRSGASG